MKDRLLFQKQGGGAVRASTEWGLEITSFPLIPRANSAKELPANDWFDEHGLDEYTPSILPMKEYELTIGFVYRGEPNTAIGVIADFLAFLANGGSNKIYSTRLAHGRQQVRFISYETAGAQIDSGCDDVVVFSVSMQVNDPITDIKLEYDG